MDWSKLPDVIASGLMAVAFASVARSCRSTESANWLNGWYFIVVHFVAMLFSPLPGVWGALMLIIALMSLFMAALLYMRASAREPYYSEFACTTMVLAMAAGFLIFLTALVFEAPRWALGASEALLGLTPLAMTLIFPQWTSLMLRWATSALALVMWAVMWREMSLPDGPQLTLNTALFSVYLACTIHFWYRNRRASTGAIIGIAGFMLWASVFVLAPALAAMAHTIKLEGEIWNLPKYIVAVGMILLMLEEQIAHNKYLALHDELTGLPNRRLFQDRLAGALERARRAEKQTALLVVDLDDFKYVNDTFGHDVGDQLLQQVAGLFRNRIRSSDTIARTGGDEFAVILEPPASRAEAKLVTRALLDLLKKPLRLGDHEVSIGASVGVAIFPDDATDARTLCIRADMKMYEGKRGEELETGFKARGERVARKPSIETVNG